MERCQYDGEDIPGNSILLMKGVRN